MIPYPMRRTAHYCAAWADRTLSAVGLSSTAPAPGQAPTKNPSRSVDVSGVGACWRRFLIEGLLVADRRSSWSGFALVGPLGRAESLDDSVKFVAARCRPNTMFATASGWRVFFAYQQGPGGGDLDGCFEFSAQPRSVGDGRVVRTVWTR